MLNAAEVIGFTLIAAALAAYAQYFFKKALPRFKFNLKEIVALAKDRTIILGVLIYVVGLGFYLVALRSGALSFVYPTFASSFVFIMLISKYMLGEKLNSRRIAGVLLIVVGIIAIAMTY
ncbi:MAG: EamA family transporter [Candidatus Micrarchaeia archaeon]